ncbi:MAG: hypothetical protein LAO04_08545 [Acidobacteriia bacterium]|nr:hypothetical protein [Terriglobia bacterium]
MFEDLPIELTPEYATAEIDEAIILYEGEMEVVQGDKSWRGTGVIEFGWLPYSRVAVKFRPAEPNARIDLQPSKLRVSVLDSEADLNVTRVPFAFPGPAADPVEGVVRQVDSGKNSICARLRFHIPNLPQWLGDPVRTQQGGSALKRLSLRYAEWDVTIDAIMFEGRDYAELKNSGGHRLTHVGTLVRRDGASFSLTDCESLLECISHFLSFCRGAWTRPILLSAENEGGRVIGRRWASSTVDRYKSTCSWVPSTEPIAAHLQSAFAGYADAWFSGLWGDALQTVTQWYVESSTGDVGKSIILMQAALELFAWVRLVEEKKVLAKKDWKDNKKTPFSSKLRRLLCLTSIPLSIPPDLSDLSAYCSANQALDGPEGITSIRNALVHPSPAKRARLKTYRRTLMDTWLLASWYLDLCMLNACGYRGRYSNRTVRGKWAGDEVQTVPWA